MPGFGLRITRAGVKTFVFRYRLRGRRQRLATIGRYGVLTLQQARERARRMAVQVLDGIDPLEERHVSTTTFGDILRTYVEAARPGWSEGTWRAYRSRIDRHVGPALDAIPLAVLGRRHVRELHRSLSGIPTTATACVKMIGQTLKWAEGEGLWSGEDPCAGIKLAPPPRKKRPLSGSEVVALGRSLRDLEAEGEITPWVSRAIRLLILTGCRRDEIRCLTWREVDLDAGVLRLDTESGRSIKGRVSDGAKTVPLSAPAQIVLVELDRLGRAGQYVLQGAHAETPPALGKPWSAIRSRAGLDDVRIHDLRHTYATVATGRGTPIAITSELLGHSSTQTTEIYAHVDRAPAQEAAEGVGQEIAAALDGLDGDIVEMRSRDGRG